MTTWKISQEAYEELKALMLAGGYDEQIIPPERTHNKLEWLHLYNVCVCVKQTPGGCDDREPVVRD